MPETETRIDGHTYEVSGTKTVYCWVEMTAPFTDDEAREQLRYGDTDEGSADYDVLLIERVL
jgi:hypothetical protein